MKTKTMPGGGLSLSPDKLHNLRLQSTIEFRWWASFAQMLASKAGLQQQWLKRTPATRQAFAVLPAWWEITGAQDPDPARRGVFFGLDPLVSPPAVDWRESVEPKKDADQFHDSESDIYDLYNACNGIVRGGLLDVDQLDGFSPAEARALNVPRLREIWDHTRSGCTECQRIIKALHIVRQAIDTDTKDGSANNIEALDVNHTDSIS